MCSCWVLPCGCVSFLSMTIFLLGKSVFYIFIYAAFVIRQSSTSEKSENVINERNYGNACAHRPPTPDIATAASGEPILRWARRINNNAPKPRSDFGFFNSHENNNGSRNKRIRHFSVRAMMRTENGNNGMFYFLCNMNKRIFLAIK